MKCCSVLIWYLDARGKVLSLYIAADHIFLTRSILIQHFYILKHFTTNYFIYAIMLFNIHSIVCLFVTFNETTDSLEPSLVDMGSLLLPLSCTLYNSFYHINILQLQNFWNCSIYFLSSVCCFSMVSRSSQC